MEKILSMCEGDPDTEKVELVLCLRASFLLFLKMTWWVDKDVSV